MFSTITAAGKVAGYSSGYAHSGQSNGKERVRCVSTVQKSCVSTYSKIFFTFATFKVSSKRFAL
jgi:hypothetical protein